jgi:glycosyltransferase involved in cell wall biosynthesis
MPELSPVATQPLSLILLAHNAECHVASLVRGWRDYLSSRETPFEIVFVDEGSSDQTVARAEELLAIIPELKVLRQESPGVGAALRTGLAATTCPLIACVPCELDYRPKYLTLYLAEIDKVHMQTGYRSGSPVPSAIQVVGWFLRQLWRLVFSLDSSHAPQPLPGWLGWSRHLCGLLARIFFGVGLHDVSCPFRVFRREILGRSPLQSDGDFVWVEQLAKVNFAGFILGHEVPLPIVPRAQQPPRNVFRDALRVFHRPSFGPAVLPSSTPTG